jgi:hypothetical protein
LPWISQPVLGQGHFTLIFSIMQYFNSFRINQECAVKLFIDLFSGNNGCLSYKNGLVYIPQIRTAQ